MAYLHPPCPSPTSHPTSRPAFKPSITVTTSSRHLPSTQKPTANSNNWVSEFRSKSLNLVLSGALTLGLSLSGAGIAEAKAGVNKPELLPKEFSPVIDVAGFLSDGQEKRLAEEIADIEKYTGYKLRVLAQNYPDTPGLLNVLKGFGIHQAEQFAFVFLFQIWIDARKCSLVTQSNTSGLAIKDFWQVDDRTIVFVADPTFGNILNFNVGASVDLDVPRSFWSRLAGKYGNMFYWKEKGEDGAIESAVMAISSCLKEPVDANNCSEVK